MPRVNVVAKSMKDQGKCGRCSTIITKGMPYKWWKFRYGGRHIRCMNCQIRGSELISSDKLSRLASVSEDASDIIAKSITTPSTIDDFRSEAESLIDNLRGLINTIREVGEEYGESADNIESGFQHETAMSEELREKADNCESWADEIESALDDINADDIVSEYENNEEEEENEETEKTNEVKETLENFLDRTWNDLISNVEDSFNNNPL